MQHPSGGFAYWPGVWSTDPALDWRNDWGTTYAGHFMLEAEKAGYALPGDMKSAWLRYQKERAQRWTAEQLRMARREDRERARRGRALRAGVSAVHAGAGRPARDRRHEPAARVAVAARSASAGCWPRRTSSRASRTWPTRWRNTTGCRPSCSPTPNPYTFGSLLRDRAVVLMGLTLLGRDAEADALLEDVVGAALG